jgi:hypothetical protein
MVEILFSGGYNTSTMSTIHVLSINLRALQYCDPIVLPRIRPDERRFKCANCPFYNKCMNEDEEAEDAREIAYGLNILTSRDFVHNV